MILRNKRVLKKIKNRKGEIECSRLPMLGWWLVPAETLIELRQRVVDRQNGRR